MKKFLLVLFTLMISIGAWADVNIATATFNGKNATYTEGWTTTGTGLSRTDCVVIGAGEDITSPEFDLTAYSTVTVQINARRFGTLSGSKAVIDCAIAGSSVGTIEATGTNASNNAGSFTFAPTSSMDAATLVFTCTNATSEGSTHGAGIGTITITGVVATTDPYITPSVETISLDFSATSGSFTYTLGNENGSTPTAVEKVDVNWISNITVDTDAQKVTFAVDPNTGEEREAVIVLTYADDSHEITVTQAKFVKDFTELPLYIPAGTSSADLKATDGVTGFFDGTDYNNATHKVKFGKNTHYLQIKADEAIGICKFSFRGCAGAGSSTFTLSGSADGANWTEVETFTLTFSAKDEVLVATNSESFDNSYRYLKLAFKKLSGEVNCGLGEFTINNTTSYLLTIGETSWATLCLGFSYAAPDGVTFYAVSAATAESVELAEVTTGVKGSLGVLVHGEPGNYIVEATDSYDSNFPNLLKGTLTATTCAADENYVLGDNGNGTASFGLYHGTTLAANKAYLPASLVPAGARPTLALDGTTGIDFVGAEQAMKMYDLQGRQLNSLQKGINIVGGKKVIVK